MLVRDTVRHIGRCAAGSNPATLRLLSSGNPALVLSGSGPTGPLMTLLSLRMLLLATRGSHIGECVSLGWVIIPKWVFYCMMHTPSFSFTLQISKVVMILGMENIYYVFRAYPNL